jgi:hypothetical protein
MVSVHVGWLYCFEPLLRKSIMVTEHMPEEAAHLTVVKKPRKEKGAEVKIHLSSVASVL